MKRKSRGKDLNILASSIMKEATEGKPTQPVIDEKSSRMIAIGRLGGLKGGKSRAKKLSNKRRSEIAKKAAHARWSK